MNNKIESIDGNVFDGNTALENVNLSNNPIRKIDGQIFTNNKKLANVSMKKSGCIDEDVRGISKIGNIASILKAKCG